MGCDCKGCIGDIGDIYNQVVLGYARNPSIECKITAFLKITEHMIKEINHNNCIEDCQKHNLICSITMLGGFPKALAINPSLEEKIIELYVEAFEQKIKLNLEHDCKYHDIKKHLMRELNCSIKRFMVDDCTSTPP